jgi:glycosyltransferase involved in cell wall biosynthesis
LKIIIVTNYYYPETGAAPNRLTLMAEHLQFQGAAVKVICPLPNYPRGAILDGYRFRFWKTENINNIEVFRYFIYPSVSKRFIVRIFSMLSFAVSLWLFCFNFKSIKNASLVIVQHSPMLVSFSAILLFNKILNKKIILNVSDLWPKSALDLGVLKKNASYKLLERVEKFNYNSAHAFIGQSKEILAQISSFNSKPSFLYRNIPQRTGAKYIKKSTSTKIIYAGLLGVAQGIYSLIDNINFRELGIELHLFGDGNEKNKIDSYITDNPQCNIFLMDSLPKNELDKIMSSFDASLIPLSKSIYGAVPSKIFDVISHGLPIIFCGDGEGAKIISDNNLGYCCEPGDFLKLTFNLIKLKSLSEIEHSNLSQNCLRVSKEEFDFHDQIKSLNKFLNNQC